MANGKWPQGGAGIYACVKSAEKSGLQPLRSSKNRLFMKPIFSAFFLLLSCATFLAQTDAPSPAEQKILDLLNHERAAQKLPALAWNVHAAQAARKHSRLLAQHGELSHHFAPSASRPPLLRSVWPQPDSVSLIPRRMWLSRTRRKKRTWP